MEVDKVKTISIGTLIQNIFCLRNIRFFLNRSCHIFVDNIESGTYMIFRKNKNVGKLAFISLLLIVNFQKSSSTIPPFGALLAKLEQ